MKVWVTLRAKVLVKMQEKVQATMCLMQRELCEPPMCSVLHARGGLQVLDVVPMVPICVSEL